MRTAMLAIAIVSATGFADAGPPHWREQVTYMSLGSRAYPSCLFFQTVAGGGKQGIDNSADGDAKAPGFDGKAKEYAVGLVTDAASAGMFGLWISSARYSNGGLPLNFVDFGPNTPAIYNDCPADGAVIAVGRFGQ